MNEPQNSPNARPAGLLTFWHLLFLFFGSQIAAAILCIVIFDIKNPSPFVRNSVEVLAGGAMIFVFYHYMGKTLGWPSLRQWFVFTRGKILMYCFLAPIVIAACWAGLAALAYWLFGDLPEIPQSQYMPSGVAQIPLSILTAVIVGPASEELFFRGVVFVWLRARLSLLVSILLTSLIFALLHDNHFSLGPVSIFPFCERFGMGVGTALLAQHFRSLAPGYALHIGWNLVAVLVAVLSTVS